MFRVLLLLGFLPLFAATTDISSYGPTGHVVTVFGDEMSEEWFFEKSTEKTILQSYVISLQLDSQRVQNSTWLLSNPDPVYTNYVVAEWTRADHDKTERALIKLHPFQSLPISLYSLGYVSEMVLFSTIPFELEEHRTKTNEKRVHAITPPQIVRSSVIETTDELLACTCFRQTDTKITIINNQNNESVVAWATLQISSTNKFQIWIDYPHGTIFHEPKASSTFAICGGNYHCAAKTQRKNNPGMTHIWYELNNVFLSGGRGRVECEFDCVSPGISWTYYRSN